MEAEREATKYKQVEFLETFLARKAWSEELDDTLAKELPWPPDQLAKMRAAAQRIGEHLAGMEKVRTIGDASPFRTTRLLAVIARITLEDWTALNDAPVMLDNPDASIRTEMALALSDWRTLFGPGLPSSCRRDVLDELRRYPLRATASVRLALLGEPTGEPFPPGDFATALAENDVDFLSAVMLQLDDASRQCAAAQRLIQLGVLAPIAPFLRFAPAERQLELMGQLDRRRKPLPELREALFALAENGAAPEVRQCACNLLCYGCPPDEALRVARAGRGEFRVYQTLLQKALLPPSAIEEFGEFLLQRGEFKMSQYGISDIAKQGRMPPDFVPRHWLDAGSETRIELLKFAEVQLCEYGDEGLHRFVVDVAFTPVDVKVQSQAWSGLYRWYNTFGYPRHRPLKVSAESIARFFGSARQFVIRFAEFLQAREILDQSLHRDEIARFLSYPDSSALQGIAASPREALSLAETLTGVMLDYEVDFTLRLACTDFVGFLGAADALREPVAELLIQVRGTDLNLQSQRALERMADGPAWTG